MSAMTVEQLTDCASIRAYLDEKYPHSLTATDDKAKRLYYMECAELYAAHAIGLEAALASPPGAPVAWALMPDDGAWCITRIEPDIDIRKHWTPLYASPTSPPAQEGKEPPLSSVEARYSDLLARLGVNGHDGAIAEIDSLRRHIAPTPPSEKERERLGDEAERLIDALKPFLKHSGGDMSCPACHALNDLEELLLSQADAPVGWVSVPVEPTIAMLIAGSLTHGVTSNKASTIYRAMCAAKPLPAAPRPAGSAE